MTRCVGLLILIAWTLSFRPVSAAESVRPNIVIFLVDDMGMMDTSVPFLTDAAGKPQRYPLNDYYRTPGMERLAASGIRFNQFYAMSVCSPTRVAIMTGQNAARHRVTNWIHPDKNNAGPFGPPDWNWEGLKPGDVTLARQLHQAGYQTAHVGKGHFSPRKFTGSDPLTLGFDRNIGGGAFGAPGSYYGRENFGNGGRGRQANNAVPHLEKYHGSDLFLTEALTMEAKSLLSDMVQQKQPFYLNFAHYAVHAPFQSDPRFAAHYEGSGKSPQAQAFATLIEGMDKSLGDVLNHLEELGVAENTLIFFLGDNGSDAPLGHQHAVACAAPLRGKKGAHYEGGMRVPFIASWAKVNPANPLQQQLSIPPNAIQSQIASVCDLFPTVLDVVGAKLPPEYPVDGDSLRTLLQGKADPAHPESFLMHYPHAPHRSDYWTSYREGDWKVIYHYVPSAVSGNSHYQLFNLKSDPFEQQDLAKSEPRQLRQMMERLAGQLREYNAVYPLDEDLTGRRLPVIP